MRSSMGTRSDSIAGMPLHSCKPKATRNIKGSRCCVVGSVAQERLDQSTPCKGMTKVAKRGCAEPSTTIRGWGRQPEWNGSVSWDLPRQPPWFCCRSCCFLCSEIRNSNGSFTRLPVVTSAEIELSDLLEDWLSKADRAACNGIDRQILLEARWWTTRVT
jgi:hypothetical protein